MGKLFKLIFFIIIVGGILLLTPIGKKYQAKTMAVINPAAAGQQALDSVEENLSSISKTINGPAGKNLSTSEKAVIKDALADAESSLAEAQEHISQSNLATGINSLINKILPRPSPAAPVVCPN